MQNGKLFKQIIAIAFWGLAMTFPNGIGDALAQQKPEPSENLSNLVQFERLTLQKLTSISELGDFSKPEELELAPLSEIEEKNAKNLNSHWAWPEYTLEMIDSYSPFIFRSKKSQSLDEVKILLDVNSKGKVSGFEVLGTVDKGLRERLDHMIRKLPECKPVPGFSNYSPERFELTLKK
ncbi:hypothetical protein [Algoriphagus litoralis]|uniref:hypothetical protein n=1 Tax=Algoriphagus litoralis TaxID=2202829 RepID=UPI000DBA2C15|nr:hypothetical protein [Algoriphagus litoralis]